MVKETRIVIELGDLTGIRLRCNGCGGEVVRSPKAGNQLPQNCPLCNQPWWNGLDSNSIGGMQNSLLIVLDRLLTMNEGSVQLRLELEGKEA